MTCFIQDEYIKSVSKIYIINFLGTTPEDFIKPDSTGKSPYSRFRERLSDKLGTAVENVEIISILKKDEFTDVRFSAHGSPYYSPTKMNGVILNDKTGVSFVLSMF